MPDDAWFALVLPQLSPQVRALVLLLTLHGLRVGEALARIPADLDTTQQPWNLHIPDTKTGEPAIIELSARVSVERLRQHLFQAVCTAFV